MNLALPSVSTDKITLKQKNTITHTANKLHTTKENEK